MKRGRTIDRLTLQELGDQLDLETDYRWLIDQVAVPAIAAHPTQDLWLVDAVRKDRQVAHFRQEFPGRVIHIHLTADEGVLRERYEARLRAGNDYEGNKSYDTAIRHPNELAARSLREIADHTIETSELRPERILEVLLNTLG
jgi:RNase adaptor protein for sRNA GlmZ degradation